MTGRLARDEHRTQHVRLPYPPEIVDGCLDEWSPAPPSRVVDEDIVVSKLGDDAADHPLHFLFPRNVAHDSQRAKLGRRFVERVGTPPADRDLRAAVAQQ